MKLALEVERGDEVVPVEVGLELEDNADLAHVLMLVGADTLSTLARGEWDPEAAKAIIYVNLIRALDEDPADPPFPFTDMRLDWGELAPYMMDPDPEMEAALADLSEEA